MKTFDKLDFISPLHRALADNNYQTPTPIQAQTIPPAMEGRDVLGCAQTGTGKTAAFALPILNKLGLQNVKAKPNRPLVLVLAPTRELAIQIEESFASYGRHLRIKQALVYGGVNQNKQVRALNMGAHIVVATPGRLLDLMEQGHIRLDGLKQFVLDEADRMLDMGFLPDLKRIIRKLPARRQSLFFSATMPPNIIKLSESLLTDPVSVNVTPKVTSVVKIKQRVMFVERGEKQDLLRKILSGSDVHRTIVFTRTKRTANMVSQRLEKNGVKAAAIHGNKSQNARQRALEAFRSNRIDVLVATDVAARGIDIDGISHVINFDLPNEPEAYVHRIGRTGRAGAEGVAIAFCSNAEQDDLLAIEKLIGQQLQTATVRPRGGVANSDARPQTTRRRKVESRPRGRNGTGSRSKNPNNQASQDGSATTRKRRPRRKNAAQKNRVRQAQ